MAPVYPPGEQMLPLRVDMVYSKRKGAMDYDTV